MPEPPHLAPGVIGPLPAEPWGPPHDTDFDAWVGIHQRPGPDSDDFYVVVACCVGLSAPLWVLGFVAWHWWAW